jgi:hypothetical protein
MLGSGLGTDPWCSTLFFLHPVYNIFPVQLSHAKVTGDVFINREYAANMSLPLNMQKSAIGAILHQCVGAANIKEICEILFMVLPVKETVTKFFASGFFHGSPSPKPLKTALESFQNFSKIRGDIRKSRCTTGINDTGGEP